MQTPEQLKKERVINNQEYRWNKNSVSINNYDEIEKLSHKIQKLFEGSTHERIGFSFRTIIPGNDKPIIVDTSPRFEFNKDDTAFIDGKNFLQYVQEYQQYVKNRFDLKAKPEVMYYYYDLDLKNSKIVSFDSENYFLEQVIPLKNKQPEFEGKLMKMQTNFIKPKNNIK